MADRLLTSDLLMVEIGTAMGIREAIKRNVTKKDKYRELRAHLLNGSIISEQSGKYMNTIRNKVSTHFKNEVQEMGSTRTVVRLEPENILRANYQIWRAFRWLDKISYEKKIESMDIYKGTLDMLYNSVHSGVYRLGLGVSSQEQNELVAKYNKLIPLAAKKLTLSELLRRSRDESNSKLAKIRSEFRKEGVLELPDVRGDNTKNLAKLGLKIINMDRIICIESNKGLAILTPVHFNRLLNVLESFAHLEVGTLSIRRSNLDQSYAEVFLESFESTIEEDADALGEVIKGCKNVLVASLATDNIMSDNQEKSMLSTMDTTRSERVMNSLVYIRSYFKSVNDMINFCNIYKITPHADSNMQAVFDSIRGLQAPNRVKRNIRERFKGTLRRALFKSLKGLGYDVRLSMINQNTDLGKKLEVMSESPAPDRTVMGGMSYSHWANVRFDKVRNMINPDEVKIPVSSKSSQVKGPVMIDDLEIAKEEFTNEQSEDKVKYKSEQYGTVNDAAEAIRGNDSLNSPDVIKRFKSVISLHEKFEAKYPGQLPEDIPSEDFEAFLRSNPEATYLVGTEPKFGEYHKKVTRMFYMAEQELKSITQRAERVGRHVSGKQFGVSIVKSFKASRMDLESFCSAMAAPSDDNVNTFVSFDMSEFSKKFPMELLRFYGEILSEITGCDWLSRLDIVFRAAIVIHNTRGFFDIITCVKGGFEGFFNFIWSSIHAVIMEMSLDATGVSGSLLTFSDDGLLMFTIPRDDFKAVAKRKVMAIQRVYMNCGLIFHLVKTLVSTVVWEYLGVVCDRSRFVNSWMKELCSIGKTEAGRGLNPLQHRIRAVEAQSVAYISAGGDPLAAYILKHFHASRLLRNITPDLTLDELELLLITPSTCGGFRISSPLESMSTMTIEKDAEILSDIYLSGRVNARISAAIYHGIICNSEQKPRAIDGVLSGSRFNTNHPDTSGMGVLNEAIDLIKDEGDLIATNVENPLKTAMGERLNQVIIGVNDLDVQIVSDVIYATPQWKMYSDALSLVKGSGAIKIIRRSSIKILQAKDTYKCKQSIAIWKRTLDEVESTDVNFQRLIDESEMKTFPGCNMMRIRPSARIALAASAGQKEIIVEVDHEASISQAESMYNEPHIRFQRDYTTMAWNAEKGEGFTTKTIRLFAETVARILVSSPDSEPFVRVLASAVGIRVPTIAKGILIGAHRGVGSSGGNRDISMNMPRMFDASSRSRYLEPLRRYVYDLDRADRTTYLEAARGVSCFKWLSEISSTGEIVYNKSTYSFSIDPAYFEVMHKNSFPVPNAKLPRPWITPDLSESIIRDYRDSFMEHVTFHRWYSSIDNAKRAEIDLTPEEIKMMNFLAIKGISNWLKDIVRSKNARTIPETMTPSIQFNQSFIYRKAVIEASWFSMKAGYRKEVQKLIRDAVREGYSDATMSDINTSFAFSVFRDNARSCVDILLSANIPGCNEGDLSPIIIAGKDIIYEIERLISESMLVKPGQIIVMKSHGQMTGRFTAAHRAAYQEAYENTINYLYDICVANRWRRNEIARKLIMRADIDEVLDVLSATKSILRESEHRGTGKPYNLISAEIQLCKLYSIVEHMIRVYPDITTFKEFREKASQYATFELDEYSISDSLGYVTNDGEPTFGRDHINLCTTEVTNDIYSRAHVHYKYCKSATYSGKGLGSIGKDGYAININKFKNILTSFYEVILAPASRSITEYPWEVEEELMKSFEPSANATVALMGVTVEPHRFVGKLIDFESTSSEELDECMTLMQAHLSSFVSYAGIIGFDVQKGEGEAHAYITGGITIKGGETLSPMTSMTQTSYKYGIIRCKRAEAALTTYVNLALIGGTLVTIFRDIYTEDYMISFCMSVEPVVFEREGEYPLADPEFHGGPKKASDVISSMTLQQRVGLSATPSISSSGSTIRGMIVMPRNNIICSYVRTIGGVPQMNDESLLLQAAAEMAKEQPTPAGMLGCYSAVALWMARMEAPEYIARMSQKVNRLLRDPATAKNTINDIALTWTWLAATQLCPSIDLDTSDISIYRGQILSVNPPINIPVTVQARKIKTYNQVRDELPTVDLKKVLGNFQEMLYEELPRIEELAYDFGDEEEAGISMQETLDDIFGI